MTNVTFRLNVQILLCVLLSAWIATVVAQVPKVAVVGAGLGGALSAARVIELAPPDLQPEIDIFEAAEHEGGRVQDFDFEDEALELGASIFWDHNVYVKTAAQRLGLRLRQLGGRGRGRQDVESAARQRGKQQQQAEEESPGAGGPTVETALRDDTAGASSAREERGFTVWNGTAFVVNMTGSWLDMVHAALRYGTAAMRYKWLVGDAFRRFRRVYDMQAAGTTWDTPEQLLRSLELYNETQQRCSDHMRSWLERPSWWLWGGAEFADEVAGAANRCNYNQNNDQMNAFAGLVSYMPAAYGAIWQIEGGNRQLVSGLLAASGARLVAPARVTAVRRWPQDGSYTLEVRVRAPPDSAREEEEEVFGLYDAVVIAVPLTGSEIQFDLGDDSAATDGGGSSEIILPQPYQVTVTTYVAAGRLRPSYFGVAQVPPVKRVFVTSGAETPFSSLALTLTRPAGRSTEADGRGRQQQQQRVYKIFSKEEPSPELLGSLFEEADSEPPRVLASKRWYAYPRFRPPERFSPFRLAPGLVYGNALEPAASAMEIAAIEAHNSALLVTAHLGERLSRSRRESARAEEAGEVAAGASAGAAVAAE